MTGAAAVRPVPAPPVPAQGAAPASTREVEVKFRADAAVLAAVRAACQGFGASPGAEKELVSTYFDTPGRDLQRSGLTLRVRRKGRAVPLLGAKWNAPATADPFARGEIEVRSPQGLPDIELFVPELRDRLKAAVGDRPLAPVFETRFKRRTAMLRHGLSDIELALDEGHIAAGEQRLPLAEVELELKTGTATDLVSCARAFAQDCGLSLEFEAKAARGYRLALALAPQPQKAQPVELSPATSFDDLVAAVIAGSLAHFTANWAALRQSDAPESIHQLRVALRRMRSALGIFRKVVSLPELEDIRAEARRIATAFGPARESDAFRANALAGPLRNQPQRLEAAALLLDAVEARRAESYVAARRVLEDPATTLFVLDVQTFLARRAWRTALSPADLGLLTSEAKDFAAAVLARLRRRALKRGKQLPDMPDAERHELRIALKNLRYAAEFFGGLFDDGKQVRQFLRIVADLQEDLGAHNDAATAESFINSLGLPPAPSAHFSAGYLLGFYRHATLEADGHLGKKWKSFRRARTFWE